MILIYSGDANEVGGDIEFYQGCPDLFYENEIEYEGLGDGTLGAQAVSYDASLPDQFIRYKNGEIEKLGSSGEKASWLSFEENAHSARPAINWCSSPFYGTGARGIQIKDLWWLNPWASIQDVQPSTKSVKLNVYVLRYSYGAPIDVIAKVFAMPKARFDELGLCCSMVRTQEAAVQEIKTKGLFSNNDGKTQQVTL